MSQLYSNCPPYWNSNDQRFPETPSKGLTLKVDYPSQHDLTGKSLNFHLHDQDSPSSQSTQSNHDLAAIAANNSHDDQCMSSDCGQEDSFHKNVRCANPVYAMGGHPETAVNTSQIDYSHGMAYMPYPSADRYFNGLLTAYAPGPVMQPDMMGVTTPRVPLPLDITEDEPIYVNAKQYHGILRRRQLRAKLEAQNKLVKNRKPYLHESRHLHALNRVRGSGGRFLSTKKSQQPNSSTTEGVHAHATHALVSEPGVKESGTLNFLNGDVFFQQADRGFLSMSSTHTSVAMQQNGASFMKDSNQHFSPMVQ